MDVCVATRAGVDSTAGDAAECSCGLRRTARLRALFRLTVRLACRIPRGKDQPLVCGEIFLVRGGLGGRTAQQGCGPQRPSPTASSVDG